MQMTPLKGSSANMTVRRRRWHWTRCWVWRWRSGCFKHWQWRSRTGRSSYWWRQTWRRSWHFLACVFSEIPITFLKNLIPQNPQGMLVLPVRALVYLKIFLSYVVLRICSYLSPVLSIFKSDTESIPKFRNVNNVWAIIIFSPSCLSPFY